MSGTDNSITHAMRAGMAAVVEQGVASLPALPSTHEEFWTTLTLPSGFASRCLIIRPKTRTTPSPLMVLFYGGGFEVGSPDMMTRPGRELAAQHNAVVVCPTYKLVPENGWRDVMLSAWELLCHLSTTDTLGADLTKGFVIGGISAGATLACSLTALSLLPAGAEGKPSELGAPVTGVWACTPLVVWEPSILPAELRPLWKSRVDNAFPPVGLDAAGVERTIALVGADPTSAWVSPFNCLDAAFSGDGRPRFHIQACQLDPLRDDGLLLERALRELGVETRLDLMTDDGHLAWVAVPPQWSLKTEGAGEMTMGGLAWLLEERKAEA